MISTPIQPQRYQILLEGPATLEPTERGLFGSYREWRSITIELEVGSPECPDYEKLQLILTAIQDMIKIAQGTLSDAVIAALSTHTKIVDTQQTRRR
jgi:hypothetical protein